MNATKILSFALFLAWAAPATAESPVKLEAAEPWAPHAKAAPMTAQRGEAFILEANGTRTCSGGWQWRFDGIVPGRTYEISTVVAHRDVAVLGDAISCLAIWGAPGPGQARPGATWDFLLPEPAGPGLVRYSRRLVAPAGATRLTVRATLRWTTSGKTSWQMPQVALARQPVVKRPPLRVAVVTGNHTRRGLKVKTVRDNVDFYGRLCEAACREHRPQLIVLPEIALHAGLPGSAIDLAVPAPGPETDAFAAIARKHGVRIALGMYERDGDAVHNSLVMIGPSGAIDGRYRKVHLAVGEDASGILPGDSFPVFDTEAGRIGANICKDSSVEESARMVALNGADLLLLPIMGDHRADRWSQGSPIFSEDRWRVIMRARAIDNQVCMIVARNAALGSCIVDRKGEVLAWNDGDRDFIVADVPLDDGYRMWQGGSFRDANWLQRRPHLYGASAAPARRGGVMK